jgi:hypothetical protein
VNVERVLGIVILVFLILILLKVLGVEVGFGEG